MWVALATVVASALADGQSPSETSCPDPAEVAIQLHRLGVERSVQPEIAVTDNRMRVVLRGPDGEIAGSRQVEAPASCHERAAVAAVLVATWMGVWPGAAKPEEAAPAAPRDTAQLTDDGQGFGIAAALDGAFDGNGLAMGITAEANGRLAGPLRAWLGLSASTERERNIDIGHAGYTRPAVAVGPSLRIGHGRVQGELGLGGSLGLLFLRGKGLPTTKSKTRAVPGASGWLRLMLVGRPLSPFLSAGGTYWFGRETATLDESSATASLPRWDARLGLGVFWGMGR